MWGDLLGEWHQNHGHSATPQNHLREERPGSFLTANNTGINDRKGTSLPLLQPILFHRLWRTVLSSFSMSAENMSLIPRGHTHSANEIITLQYRPDLYLTIYDIDLIYILQSKKEVNQNLPPTSICNFNLPILEIYRREYCGLWASYLTQTQGMGCITNKIWGNCQGPGRSVFNGSVELQRKKTGSQTDKTCIQKSHTGRFK